MTSLNQKTRVLVVDDSAVIRTVVTRTIEKESDMEIVGTAINGELGVKSVEQLKPDVVILDIEMPIMDGITALPLILEKHPSARVLICSTLSSRGADISIKALTMGAAECLLKPSSGSIVSAEDFQNDLVRIVRSLGRRMRPSEKSGQSSAQASTALVGTNFPKFEITTREKPKLPPKILAIGSSTGGPKALISVLKDINKLPIPIVITQHMPKTFTSQLANHITESCGLICQEGTEGCMIEAGKAYLAPGGYHMELRQSNDGVRIHLTENEPENYCRPSVEPMIRSLFPIYGSRILATILTGMGNDGIYSCKQLVEKEGGHVIAQDEETSVVWGMPRAVAKEGICSAILPLNQIPSWINTVVKGTS